MRTLLQDLLYSLRVWRRNPTSSLAVILVLALGIAGNTVMFSAFHAWVLRPLDLEDPERLMTIYNSRPRDGELHFSVSGEDASEWRSRSSIEELALFDRHDFNYQDDQSAERVRGARIDANLLPILGRPPILGRSFSPSEDVAGQPAAVVLISDSLWRERFSANPRAIGQSVRLDGRAHEIVGVMPPGFGFPEWARIWTPLGAPIDGDDGERRIYDNVARLSRGTLVEQAQADLQTWAADLEVRSPETHRGWTVRVEPLREKWMPPVIRVALSASLGAAFLVLLVICANVAGLLLAQAEARSREMAVRSALGASRARLARQTLTETVGLALLGAVLGVPLAALFNRWMLSWVPVDPPYLFAMHIDPRAVVYTVIVALAAGVAAGVAPMMRHSRAEANGALAGGRSTVDRVGRRTSALLVAGELALSTALVIASLLMVKSFLQQSRIDPGLRSQGVLSLGVSLRGDGLDDADERIDFVSRASARLRALPTIAEVAGVSRLPTAFGGVVSLLAFEAVDEEVEPIRANHRSVEGDYFHLLEVPLLEGRSFRANEDEVVAPLVVSHALAQRLFPGESAVGRRIREVDGGGQPLTVIGVVGDIDVGTQMMAGGNPQRLDAYVPWRNEPTGEFSFVLRSPSDLGALAPIARAALNEVDAGVPVGDVLSLDESIRQRRWTMSFFSYVLSLYAVVAILVSVVGTYGLTADAVGRRRREMAIRSAMGAGRWQLLAAMMRSGMRVGVVGVGLGLVLAFALTRLGANMLVDVDAQDPPVFGGVALVLVGAVALAVWLPARRCLRIDPASVLRSEG